MERLALWSVAACAGAMLTLGCGDESSPTGTGGVGGIGPGGSGGGGSGGAAAVGTTTDACPEDPNKDEPGRCGCGVAEGASEAVTVGPFQADYYRGETLVASEQVARPTINYPWSDFHGIDSEDFRAVWTGTVSAAEAQTVDINFDVSWAEVTLTIDGVLVDDWEDSSKTIAYDLAPGPHDVLVEYTNNWHTTGFNVSFTTSPVLTNAEAQAALATIVATDPWIVYVGAYESDDLYNDIVLGLSGSARVLLFVSTYASVNWVLDVSESLDLVGVVYSAYGPGPTVESDPGLCLLEVENLSYGYDQFDEVTADIENLTGRAPDQMYGEYGLVEWTGSFGE